MDIFVINTNDIKNIKPDLLEKFRHKNFSDVKKQKEHCFLYLMLDCILREVYAIQKREIEFVNKKPYLKTKEKFFSLSHSGEYITIGFSNHECGIDIEKIKKRDFLKISKRMNFSCNTLNEFYKDWTKYEAVYKLGANPQSIEQTQIDDYILTAVSINSQEKFNIYIQNGEKFPNL